MNMHKAPSCILGFTCTLTCTHTHARTYARTHARTHRHTHTHRQTHRHTHTDTHTQSAPYSALPPYYYYVSLKNKYPGVFTLSFSGIHGYHHSETNHSFIRYMAVQRQYEHDHDDESCHRHKVSSPYCLFKIHTKSPSKLSIGKLKC